MKQELCFASVKESFRKLCVFQRFCCVSLVCAQQVKSEETVYQGVITWVKHDEPARLKYLSRLLDHVRLPLLSVNFITDVLDSEVGTLIC